MLFEHRLVLRHDVTCSIDGHRKLRKRKPPYSHCSTPSSQCSQKKGLTKHGSRCVLKKRRRFADSPLVKPPTAQQRRISSSFVDPMQKPATSTSFLQSASASKHSLLLPNLRPDSLWLGRPTQPLRIRKSPQSPPTPPPSTPHTGHRSGPHVISNSPMLPIGGNVPPRSPTPRAHKSTHSTPTRRLPPGACVEPSTNTFSPPIQTGLETLIASIESEFKHVQHHPLLPRPISVATSLSVYSQSSAAYSVLPESQDFPHNLKAISEGKKDGERERSDTYSIRSAETVQLRASQGLTVDDSESPHGIYFGVDPPRLSTSASTSTHASHKTFSTSNTLVDLGTPPKEKKHLESTRLSLQPCPSLASAHRILSLNDLPPDHDASSPIDENTYRRYEHEGKIDSPFNDDICADYDYIYAIDVLIYGARPLPDVPVDVARQSSTRSRPKRDNSIRRRGSDRRPAPVAKKVSHTNPLVSFNRETRKNSLKMDPNTRVTKTEARNELRRSIFFQD
ncbi:hypothetical protein BDN70DRAFT_877726 [Pholiota conissans]|uniref:Uncharacterized protein n=1 Tax=Pholiota conissans TaxID=109636 RepID=A0A9P6D264_9AGAR|nr:hypothetical protein BDN70DRAFT_877726 [Pholiota conissans]